MSDASRRRFAIWRGSTLQVIAAVVLPLTLLLVGISFGSFFIHQNAMRSMVGERDERAVRAAASAIDSEIKHRIDTLRGLARIGNGLDSDQLANVLKESGYLGDSFNYGLAFISSGRELLAHTGETGFWQAVTARAGFQGMETLTSQGILVVLVSFPSADGKILAVGAFSASNLLQDVLEKDFPADGNAGIYVFDQAYQVLFHSGQAVIEGDASIHPGIHDALSGQSGATYVRTGNDEHVLAYSPIPVTGWAVVVEESWEVVSNPTLQTSQITPMILVPALLLAMLALWFGAEQIVKPLRSLESYASRLAWGDFKDIEQPVQGISEIRRLQGELVHMARQVQAAQQSLHSYIGAITQGQEDERQRLAHELHDDTLQALIALKQRAQLTRRTLPGDASPQALTELETLTEQTIEDLRRTIRALRPIYLEDLGLVAALEMLANETGQNGGLRVEFKAGGQERRLSGETELALYRMVQEALNNVVRHARASRASVKIEFDVQAVSLKVSDNGAGFEVPKSPAEFAPGGHFGLVGLYERAQLIGAVLEIKSEPGRGTQVSIHLPGDIQNSKQ